MRWTVIAPILALVAGGVLAMPPDSYVLRDSDVTYMIGKGMSAEELKALQARFGSHFLWARRAGSRVLIRDAASLQKALEALHGNAAPGRDRDARMAAVVDRAIVEGTAQRLP